MSYFCSDEGLYKKKYLKDAECGQISGMEYVIDDILPGIKEGYLHDVDTSRDVLKNMFYSYKDDPTDPEIMACLKGIPEETIKTFIHHIADKIFDAVELGVEGCRGDFLVSMIDHEYADKSDEEMTDLWDRSSKDDYTSIDPDTTEGYTYNINNKTRPMWNRDNSWQVK